MKNKEPIPGAVILAAGESSRMKHPKALLLFKGEIRFIDKILYEFDRFGCGEIIVVTNPDLKNEVKNSKRIKVVVNENPENGRFSSIKTGLNTLNNSDYCFIHNVDNPFISHEVLKTLTQNKLESGYVFPVFEGFGGHPVLLNRTIINKILGEEKINLNFRDFLTEFDSREVKVKDVSVTVNINTIQDYKQFFNS